MLERYTGCTVSEAYATGSNGIHMPRYPYYAAYDLPGECHYYYRRSVQYLTCQTARFLLIGGEATTLVKDGVVDFSQDLTPWWHGFFQEHFGKQMGEIVRYAGGHSYLEYLGNHPQSKLVVPHPYPADQIASDHYYLENPELIVQLNDKGRMADISSHCIPYEVYDAATFAGKTWREHWELPFVIKLAAPSGGGDGVAICQTEADVQAAQERFGGHRVKVEHFIGGYLANYNLNLHVDRDGTIRFIGGSEQRISASARYEGNFIDLCWHPSPELEAIAVEIARNAAHLGWFGVCGLDVIKAADGKLYFIDPNFRLNGSTPFHFIREHFLTHFQRPNLETGYFCYLGNPLAFLETFRPEIEKKILMPVGLYYDPSYDQKTRVYLAQVTENDVDAHVSLRDTLAQRGLLPGIHL
ncbi:hypothetical protein [Thiothrix winogradskyi]|uniref:ATP-grasp domain-containing protein n=1 Tax=Thiothrix winogradskyi TaxID=96472 RepID=A0ABY3T293_9GAMM|nr:hypothetical protein [Thiothrix winogradskyi]UJS25972.1 hypothetical protein L2Y54_07970 [Thiothrix winogradskyi]